MGTCPQCAKELPSEFPFCPFCGAAVGEPPPAPASIERKVVSVLFCDLVGFTAASDAADPEDVRARIRPYHQQLKREIEGFGGTVEKFIGDAVMAVFGAPVAHEDDAERAVRTGLRVLAAIEQLNMKRPELRLEVRVGISTGEAVVDRDARPERGEGIVVGDVVNTAARLQAAAPVGGVAVGELTYRQTRRIFDYEELEPVTVKGKSRPLAIWRPVADRVLFGRDLANSQVTPLVGRESELARVRAAFELAARGPSVRMVTLVGEPGIGKSRLLLELSSHPERLPQMIRWRKGRCLPCGEGITFWALGEIVKAHAGVFETDSPERAAEKLDAVLPEVQERAWLRARLLPLLGVDLRQPPSREESFTAWQRFIESIAADGAAVVAVEDLHWADAALLDFLVHLAAVSSGAPLLVLCTARPELLERYPAWGAATPNAETINLSPLSDSESANLVQALLTRDADEHVRRAILERAGGNPLYAEELVRFIAEGGLNGSGDGDAFPDTLQALITARLDTLTQQQKSLLLDASVLGTVFWVDALAHMGKRGADEAKRILDELSQRQFVRPEQKSSMESEVEYSFWHVLVRDVAYGQIPRAERARRHRAAAAWTECKAGERVGDFAELLSNHYVEALALTEAAGDTAEAAGLALSARRYLALAGARALGLDPAQAKSRLEQALELTPDDDRDRPALILRWADAAFQTGHLREAAYELEAALVSFRELGDREAVAQALMLLSRIARRRSDPRQLTLAGEAVALLEQAEPGPALVEAHTQLALVQFWLTSLECVVTADRALSLAAQLDLPIPARALGCRGVARAAAGDPEGLADAERALELLLEQGAGREAAALMANLAAARHPLEGPAALLAGLEEAIAFCEQRGLEEMAALTKCRCLPPLIHLGRVEEALALAGLLAAAAEERRDTQALLEARAAEMEILAARGETAAALTHADWIVETARGSGSIDAMLSGLASAAAAELAGGGLDRAGSLLDELTRAPQARDDTEYPLLLPTLVRIALAAGDPGLAARLAEALDPLYPLHEHALCAARAAITEAAGNRAAAAALYTEAAERWRGFGNRVELAYALLGHGRCLVALGRSEAAEPLREARELFASFGYSSALAEADALPGQVEALRSFDT